MKIITLTQDVPLHVNVDKISVFYPITIHNAFTSENRIATRIIVAGAMYTVEETCAQIKAIVNGETNG